ncbi:MAG TPA: hypothetical protein ENJ31_00445 [Anaerolineae bacterium]|nr:hypothetical protein [Anaerolineae bacterium]
MLILNFTHPLTADQVRQIETLTDRAVAEVRHIPAQFDTEQPFAPQVVALADACGLSPEEWQTLPVLIVPPALNFIAVALLAELHGRMGYFAPVVRTRPVTGSLPPRYEVAEVLNLQAIRDAARKKR